MAPSSTTVRHITKDHAIIVPGKGWTVTTFNLGKIGGDVEAFVAADDGSETIRLLIAGPTADQAMVIRTDKDGTINIMYARKPDVR